MSDDHSPPSAAGRGADVWLATGFGIGFARFMPGTLGTLWGLPLAWGLAMLPWWCNVGIVVLLAAAGIPLCTRAARKLNQKDPGAVVWDEIVAVQIAFFGVDLTGGPGPTLARLAAGFVLFRIFDIAKPPPVRQAERLPDGLGIMADDWAAALYALALMHLLLWCDVV